MARTESKNRRGTTPAALSEAPPQRGREAATERIFEAAEQLFAQMPPSEVTTRAIAQVAQVNLALIHRYVGSKEEVLRQVMLRYAQRFRLDAQLAGTFEDGLITLLQDPKHEPFVRTLAFLILTNYPLDDVMAPEGGLKMLLSLGKSNDLEPARVMAALVMGMGWLLFDRFLLMAAGVPRSGRKISKEVFALVRQISRKPP
jgi:AcrR family transcriptional regulator